MTGGCILATRVAALRPDLIKTWAAGGGPVSKDYAWHPLAKLLQTPGAGEQWLATFDADSFSKQLEQLGMPHAAAAEAVTHMNGEMLSCILRLYRSAVEVGGDWQPALANIASPGLVMWGEQDLACPITFGEQLARDTKARRLATLKTGHWFPLHEPATVAQLLEEHWAAAAAWQAPRAGASKAAPIGESV